MRKEHDMSAEKQSLRDKLMAIILLETAKDYKEMDSDLVTECVDFLMEFEGKQRLSKAEIEQRVKDIPFKGRVTAISSYAKKRLRAKRLAVVAAVLALIVALFGIISIASGDTVSEFFRKMGNSIHHLFDGGSKAYGDITLHKSNETKTFSSIEEFAESEGMDILYPTWLPEEEKIVNIWYIVDGEMQKYLMQCNNPTYSLDIKINTDLQEDFISNCKEKEVAGFSVYYIDDSQYIQANFTYKNCVYAVKSDTEDNLFKIIENLKEII